MPISKRPVIGVVADIRAIDGQDYHIAQDKYLSAIWEAAEAMPVVIPAFGEALDLASIAAGLDGLLLTGCVSNVEPWRYGGPSAPPCGPYDPARDETVLPLIEVALSAGLPLLAICRGFQELNVALGGTLNPRIHEIPGRLDHRARYKLPLPEQYEPVHTVRLTEGGMLAGLLPGVAETQVNSLHWQGIDRLAGRLVVEAAASDGTIEAVRVQNAGNFALGVQWHPEWQPEKSPLSMALFKAFGTAARERRAG